MTTTKKRKRKAKPDPQADAGAAALAMAALMDALERYEDEVDDMPGLDDDARRYIGAALNFAWHEVAARRPKVPGPRLLAR